VITKKFRHTKLWATTTNIILIIILINIILSFFSFSVDLSANKIHSLSPATKDIIANSNDIITIKPFVSSNLPPQLIPIKETLKNILGQYQRFGRGKIKIIWVDPQKDDQAKSEALSLGIAPLQFSSVQQDKFQVVQGYFGLAVFLAEKKQVIPALQDINNLEYQLTATIKRLQQDELAQIGFTTGTGETDQTKLSKISQLLRLNYQLTSVDLSKKTEKINNGVKTLIIAGPKNKFSPEAKSAIKEYLDQKKGVIFLANKIAVGEGLAASEVDNDLDDFLENYGIKINKNLVLDSSSGLASFRTQQGGFIVPYPFWVKTRAESAAHDLPPTASLESVVFPWISSLEISKGAQALWKSTPEATVITDFNNLSPTTKRDFSNQKQVVLAAIQTNGVKMAVVGDADFIEDQTLGSYPENGQFFLNLVDYLSQDTKLISIRSKTVSSRPLKLINEKQKQTIKIINLSAGPIILLLLTLIIRWRRKNAQKNY